MKTPISKPSKIDCAFTQIDEYQRFLQNKAETIAMMKKGELSQLEAKFLIAFEKAKGKK